MVCFLRKGSKRKNKESIVCIACVCGVCFRKDCVGFFVFAKTPDIERYRAFLFFVWTCLARFVWGLFLWGLFSCWMVFFLLDSFFLVRLFGGALPHAPQGTVAP